MTSLPLTYLITSSRVCRGPCSSMISFGSEINIPHAMIYIKRKLGKLRGLLEFRCATWQSCWFRQGLPTPQRKILCNTSKWGHILNRPLTCASATLSTILLGQRTSLNRRISKRRIFQIFLISYNWSPQNSRLKRFGSPCWFAMYWKVWVCPKNGDGRVRST